MRRSSPASHVWGDVRLMMTVLRTLLGNAWKYTSRTDAARDPLFTREERDGRTWICVTDNGAGFDMAQAERLVQAVHAPASAGRISRATALGLATVQRIVKRHGGEIEAESAVSQGTTIRFWLAPRRTENGACAAAPRGAHRDCVLLDIAHIRTREFVDAGAKS